MTALRRALPALALGVPGAAVFIVLVAMLAGAAVAAGPLSVAPMTLSEAAFIRDKAEIVRQIRAGADPNAPSVVRAEFLGDTPGGGIDVTMTPLEAAIVVRRDGVAAVLMRNGAVVNEANLPRLYCFSQRMAATAISPLLLSAAAATQPPDCTNTATLW